MVSVNSGSRVPGSSPEGSHCVAFNVLHSTQVYTWVPGNLMLRVNMPWTSIPSMGWQKKFLAVSINTGTSRMAKFGSNARD